MVDIKKYLKVTNMDFKENYYCYQNGENWAFLGPKINFFEFFL